MTFPGLAVPIYQIHMAILGLGSETENVATTINSTVDGCELMRQLNTMVDLSQYLNFREISRVSACFNHP